MLHPCPNCKKEGFTWSIDEEASPLTEWRCWKCGYQEWEDEGLKWPYEKLIEKWESLRQEHDNKDGFLNAWNKMLERSGWKKEEFHAEIDRRKGL